MYSLRKIRELKNYRFFQNFKWDENDCSLFEKFNLIYGWNGCGKTTLCDFYRDLETGTISEASATFSLLFEDSNSSIHPINQDRLATIPYRFKVFHQEYISENIKVDTVRHIFSVGKEQAEKIEEVKRLRSAVTDQVAHIKRIDADLGALCESFERLKTSRAREIKDAARYSNAYNKNAYFAAHNNLACKQTLPEAEYQEALAAIITPMQPSIPLFEVSFIQPSVKEYLSGILLQTPVNNTIEALKNNTAVSNWVETGLTLHDELASDSCFFCGNKISHLRLEELRDHFNKSYKELSDKITQAIELLRVKYEQFDLIVQKLPNQALLYPELRREYSDLCIEIGTLCEQYKTAILAIIDILNRKKSDMINGSFLVEFTTVVEPLSFDYSVFHKVLELLEKHNQKTAAFQEHQKQAQKRIEVHLLSLFYDETSDFMQRITVKKGEGEAQRIILKDLQNRILVLEQEIKNSQIPADAINRDIAFIMGRSELVFYNSDLGYQIKRNGKKAKNLSKGEENAIALIYFFNTLLDVESDAANTIIVLDDPISSFDTNFYYNAIGYIREKVQQVGQVFIFTHKFSLLKDFSMMFKENTNQYILQRLQNNPQLVNLDKLISQYHDEYAFLFKKIYEFIKNPPSDPSEYLQYPNMARRVLEGFLTFKLPSTKTMMDKVLELENGRDSKAGRSILRLLNTQSHLRVIPGHDSTDDIDTITVLPDTLNQLMEFIKFHDERHYNTLAALCDPDYDQAGDAVTIVRLPTRKIKFYRLSATAGLGNYLDNDPDEDEIEVTNQECTFAVRISGDSMEPDYSDGDIALVKQCEVIRNAHVGIVSYRGDCYCKKIVQTPKGILLVSENKKYAPIPVDSLDEYHLFGEVLDVIKHQ